MVLTGSFLEAVHMVSTLGIVGDSTGGIVFTLLLSGSVLVPVNRRIAVITGRPAILVSTSLKTSSRIHDGPDDDLREQVDITAFFTLPIHGGSISCLIGATSPAEKRIEQLRQLEREEKMTQTA